jgi:hypothetical protein
MKKLFGKFALMFLLVLPTIGILNFLYMKTNVWKNAISDVGKFETVPGNIQIANVGSSHGLCSFDYRDIPYRSFNFALSSQRFIYDYAILQQYIDRFDKNAVLLIPISYFQITRIKTDFKDHRARYYQFLDKRYLDTYSVLEKLYLSIPVLTAGYNLMCIIKDIPSESEVEIKTMAGDELVTYCENKHESWTTDTDMEVEAAEEGFAYNKQLVGQIIEFCYAHEIQPVLISTPITSVLNEIYAKRSPDFFDTFYHFTRELQKYYPNLRYFDYSHDSRFEDDFPLFRDGDHLNTVGAEKFTAIVISDLRSSGILRE